MSITIYHNPRCSKSRQTLQLLNDNNIEPTVIEYLNTPPNQDELNAIIKKLGITARQLMRSKEALFKELGLDNADLDDAALITAMIQNPKLIERPIVINGNKAAIGRPPENVLDII